MAKTNKSIVKPLTLKKGIYPKPCKGGDWQNVSQTTDRALVIEHLSKVRDNLSVCNELEIITKCSEIPNS